MSLVATLPSTAVSVLGAGAGIAVSVLLWMIDRYDPIWAIKHVNDQRLTGKWHGWSVYIPVDGFYSRDSEAIYRTVVDFMQHGRRITFRETLTHIYNIDGQMIESLGPRRFSGHGRIDGEFDISGRFKEKNGLTVGSMHIVGDWRAGELTGILAVRPQIPGRPVAVKLLLREVDEPMPTWEDIGLPLLQELARDHDRRENGSAE